jgi:hypothetical protein
MIGLFVLFSYSIKKDGVRLLRSSILKIRLMSVLNLMVMNDDVIQDQ